MDELMMTHFYGDECPGGHRDEVERICPAYDSWGDLTCDLERGHEGPHNDCGAPWASPHEQDRWTA